MKSSMANIDIYAWVLESSTQLLNAKISNIYVPRENLYILKLIMRNGITIYLAIEPGKRIHITKMHIRGTGLISGKLQFIRKLLRNCSIESVKQVEFERIVSMELRCGNERRYLFIELLPRGVLCVLNNEWKILFTSESRSMKHRVIKPGVKYILPPLSPNPLKLSIEELKKLAEKGRDIVRGLVRGWGLPGELAEELLARANIDKKRKPSELSNQEWESILREFKKIINEITKNFKGYIVKEVSGELHSFHPYKPLLLPPNTEIIEYNTFNEALDKYFTVIESRIASEIARKDLEKEISKLEATAKSIENHIEKLKEELEITKRKLDVFTNNYLEVENIYKCIDEFVKRKKWDSITTCPNVKNYDSSSGIVVIQINGGSLELNVRKSLIENYNSYKAKISGISRSIERALIELNRIRDQINKLKVETRLKSEIAIVKTKRRKEWYEKYHWLITSRGLLAIGGKNAEQNESIIRRYLRLRDILLHAEIHGGSAVILRIDGKEVDKDSLEEAAILAAVYSKAWKLGLGTVDVFWVYGEQVSLAPPPGEYLPHGAFMVYGKKNFIRNVPLILAIGIEITEEGFPRVIVGSENLVSKRTRFYAVITPGEYNPEKIAEIILNKLAEKAKEHKAIVKSIDIKDIIDRIPGKSRIIKIDC